MSIVSQRTRASSTPSSILKKTTSVKSRLSQIQQTPSKVRFVLPHSKKVHHILQQFVQNNQVKDYENLVCLIRDAELLNSDISSLLKEATECISILNRDLRLFVEVILSIDWIDRDEGVVTEYRSFIINLLAAHNYHSRFVIDKLVSLFLPKPTDPEWPDGVPTKSDDKKCDIIQDLLNKILSVVPMCKEILLQTLTKQYPYYNRPLHIQEFYLYNLLSIIKYQPTFRPDILRLIFSKLVIMDVNAPKEEIEKQRQLEEELMFPMDESLSMKSSIKTAFTVVNRNALADTLDICLNQIFDYFISEFQTEEINKELYYDILMVFDKVILPTYNTHHVQFMMFIICHLHPTICEGFLNYLWKKVQNPSVPPTVRQAAVTYIASLIARGLFVSELLLKASLQQMAEWIHTYIANQDGLEYVNSDVRVHSVFYSVCQAFFYLISFRHKDLLNSKKAKKNMVFLQSLNVGKIVTSRLNPLRVCQPTVVQSFAAITRKYQLAYCYTIIDHNSRNTIPTIYQDEKGSSVVSHNILSDFFPFDPYILEKSGAKLEGIYRHHLDSFGEEMEIVEEVNVSSSGDGDIDDFLHYDNNVNNVSCSRKRKFSYGSSPGFKHK